MSKRLVMICIALLMLAMASLACDMASIFPFLAPEETTVPLPSAAPTKAASPTVNPADEIRSDDGGFAVRKITGYTVENSFGIIQLMAPGGNVDSGPMIMLAASNDEADPGGNQGMLDSFKKTTPDVVLGTSRKISIGGQDALVVDFTTEQKSTKMAGRLIVMFKAPKYQFIMLGAAPTATWEKETSAVFDAAIGTVRFFDPIVVVPTTKPTTAATAKPNVIRQWAVSAKASSEYGKPNWAASQATGAPNSLICGDSSDAWAPLDPFSQEWLEVRFATPVTPTEINIHQNYHPGQVTKVELIDAKGALYTVYTGSPKAVTECPYVQNIKVSGATYQAVGVRISLDMSKLNLEWNEVDAVELVGTGATAQATVAPAKSATKAGATAAPTKAGATQAAGGFNPSGWTWKVIGTADGLPDVRISDVATGLDGSVWAGTGKGIARYDGKVWKVFTDKDGMSNNNVQAIAIDSGGIVWVGTSWGVSRYDGSKWTKYTTDQGLLSNNVLAVTTAPGGVVYFGTSSGIARFDGSKWSKYTTADGLAANKVVAVSVDSKGVLWAATDEGVSSLTGSVWKNYTPADGIPYKVVMSVLAASDGSVWAGTGGQGAGHLEGGTWTKVRSDTTLKGWSINGMTQAPDKAVWFAAPGYGVFRFDGTTWSSYNAVGGGTMPWVYKVAVDIKGNVWVTTYDKGLLRFGP